MHVVVADVSSQRILVDKVFSVPKCMLLALISRHWHQLLKKLWGAVPTIEVDDLSEIWVIEPLSYK